MKYNTIDNIRTDYLNTIDRYECMLKAWEKVTFNYKKDGGHFASLQKNFNHASVYTASYATDPNEKRIAVYFHTNRTGYDSDELWIAESAGNFQYRVFTVDEIIAAIERRKKQIAGYIEEYRYALDNIHELRHLAEVIQSHVDAIKSERIRRDATSMIREMYFHW